MKKSSPISRNRFTDDQKRAALADMAGGMTIEKTAKKYGCSPSALWNWKNEFKSKPVAKVATAPKQPKAASGPVQSQDDGRESDLEAENKRLRKLLLDGYIANEVNIKLKKIGIIVRDNKPNQLREIMEILLATADGD